LTNFQAPLLFVIYPPLPYIKHC